MDDKTKYTVLAGAFVLTFCAGYSLKKEKIIDRKVVEYIKDRIDTKTTTVTGSDKRGKPLKKVIVEKINEKITINSKDVKTTILSTSPKWSASLHYRPDILNPTSFNNFSFAAQYAVFGPLAIGVMYNQTLGISGTIGINF